MNISVPFNISGIGGIQVVLSREDEARQRIIDWVMTDAGERLMRPNYGASLSNMIFDNMDDPEVNDRIVTLIKELTAVVPEVNIKSLSMDQDHINPSQLNITVLFSVQPHSQLSSASASLTGVVTQETSF